MKRLWILAMFLSIGSVDIVHAQAWTFMDGPKLASDVKDVAITKTGQTLYVAQQGTPAYLMKSTNHGSDLAVTVEPFLSAQVAVVKPEDAATSVVGKAGGLYQTTDGGQVWLPRLTGTYINPLRLAILTNDNNVMLMGQPNDPGSSDDRPIYRSANSGLVWGRIETFNFETKILDFAPYPAQELAHPERNSIVFAVGSAMNDVPTGATESSPPNNAGLWRSQDWGQTWEGIALGNMNLVSAAIVQGAPNDYYYRVVVQKVSGPPNVVYNVRQSSTSGFDFPVRLTLNTTMTMVRLKKSNNYLFLATGQGVYRSVDAGATWTSMSSGLGSDLGVLSVAPSAEGDLVFAGTANSLYKSTNNGITWNKIGNMNISSVEAMQQGTSQIAWAVSNGNNILAKHNGTAWERHPIGTNPVSNEGWPFVAEKIHRNPFNNKMFIAGAVGAAAKTATLYYSADGGSTFSLATVNYAIASSSRYHGLLTHPTNGNLMYMFGGGTADGAWRNFFTSADGGQTWQIGALIGSSNLSVLDMAIYFLPAPQNQLVMFATLSNGDVYRSLNGGAGWTQVANVGTAAYSVTLNRNQPTTVYAAGTAGLFKSTSNGDLNTWISVRSDKVLRVMMHPSYQNSTNRVWAIGAGGDDLYKTTNGGTSWITMSSGLADSMRTLGADLVKGGFSYVGTSAGLYRINELPEVPTITASIVSNHPNFTWSTEETDLDEGTPFEVWRYFSTCPYYCPDKQCVLVGQESSIATPQSPSYYDNTQAVIPCVDGGSGVLGLVTYYVIVKENTGATVRSGDARYHRGDAIAPEDPPGEKIAIGEERALRYFLGSNYPNPFNPVTVIRYELAENTPVTLVVYDVLGREVMRLIDGYEMAGEKLVTVDASQLSSGVYMYKLTAGKFTATKKMLLMK
jgi:photosystem II stability/assembly factor-like uncharacterized protein